MRPTSVWVVLAKNINLVLLLTAAANPALAVGGAVRGVSWTLLMPVALVAVLCGWWAGRSRLNGKQAAAMLVVLGCPGVFVYVVKLVGPLGKFVFSAYSIIPQIIKWVYDRSPVDPARLLEAWNDLSSRVVVALFRLGEWTVLLVTGRAVADPAAAGLAWSILLWLIGIWAGWQFRRKRLAIHALAPGGIVLALAIDYTREETNMVLLYLILMLALTGLAHYKDLVTGWLQRGVDYSDSIAIDSVGLAAPVIIMVVGMAMLTSSLSWEDLADKLRKSNRRDDGRVTEGLEQERPPNVANNEAYLSGGLPRLHLLSMPPEQLETIVMTVSTGEELPGSNRYYWRTRTYDLYTGVGWASRPAREIPLAAGTPLLEPTPDFRPVHQRIELASDQTINSLYWTGALLQVDTDVKIAWRVAPPSDPDPLHRGDMLGALVVANTYNIESYFPQVSKMQLQATRRNYPPEIVSRYLTIPESTSRRVLELARDLTGSKRTPYDQAIAIESYLRKIPYTLDVEPPPLGEDVVDYFLFTAQMGYCDYYASSMVVLARAVGLPARIVIGYTSGDYDSSTGQYIVRQKHAHSWVEIYFSEIGWVEFEPTGEQPSIAHSIVGGELEPDQSLSFGNEISSWLELHWLSLISTVGGRALLASLVLIGLVVLWQAGNSIYLSLLPSPIAIHLVYRRMDKAATHLLPSLSRGHTPLELQSALSNKLLGTNIGLLQIAFKKAPFEIERLTTLYMAQTFSQYPPSRSQIQRGIKEWSRLRWKLWIARVLKNWITPIRHI